MKTRRKTIWSVVLVGVGLLLFTDHVLYEGHAKPLENQALAQAQPAETRAPEATLAAAGAAGWYMLTRNIPKSIKEEYERELKEAESCIEGGGWNVSGMEAHLTLATLVVEDANISEEARAAVLKDSAEKSKAIRMKGYVKAAHENLVNTLSHAHGGHDVSMEYFVKHYRFCCFKAGLQPDEAKIRKAREILAASLNCLAELEKLEK